MAEKNKPELTPFEKETIDTAKQIMEYKLATEANVVSILYKSPDKFFDYNLTLEDFHNNIWRVYFQIASDLINVEKKEILDDITVGLYLEKHPKLKSKYEEYGGYETIQSAMGYVQIENFDGYVSELRKFKSLLKMCKSGFPIKKELSKYIDEPAEEIYNTFEALLNDIFANIDSDVKSYDITDGIYELIEKLDEGYAIGLPYYDMPMLTKETGGQYLGSITLLGGISNAGKEQPISEPVLTEDGWVQMGNIKVNTKVYGRDGELHNVESVFPQGIKDVYKVSFSDGTSTRCGLEHLWRVYTQKQIQRNSNIGIDKYYSIVTLSDIINDYKVERKISGNTHIIYKYSVPLCEPIDFKSNEVLPMDPYKLGEEIGKNNIEIIPDVYKRSSIEDRSSLLSGIINSCGHIDKNNNANILMSTYSKILSEDISDISRSLGYRVSVSNDNPYIIRIISNDWSLLNLSDKHKKNLRTFPYTKTKYITNIEYVGKEESQCILLDSDEHLYITKDYTVTHNSTVVRSTALPSILKNNEKVVVMVNEDSLQKWQREMLVWICNNILKFDIQKHVVRDGRYSSEVKKKLYEAADWLSKQSENHKITVIPFLQYQTSKAIKQIKKYASLGVKYFILDTFKMDAGKVSSNSWLEMQQSMVSIKDVIKTESLNVHILITFQLEKGSAAMRYYTQNNIGMAKNIVDVASTCIMVRDIFGDEYDGEKRALHVYQIEGSSGKSKVIKHLDKNKKYQVFFIVKNQEGSANDFQIVTEHDKSRNVIREIGITNISPDGF